MRWNPHIPLLVGSILYVTLAYELRKYRVNGVGSFCVTSTLYLESNVILLYLYAILYVCMYLVKHSIRKVCVCARKNSMLYLYVIT